VTFLVRVARDGIFRFSHAPLISPSSRSHALVALLSSWYECFPLYRVCTNSRDRSSSTPASACVLGIARRMVSVQNSSTAAYLGTSSAAAFEVYIERAEMAGHCILCRQSSETYLVIRDLVIETYRTPITTMSDGRPRRPEDSSRPTDAKAGQGGILLVNMPPPCNGAAIYVHHRSNIHGNK